MSAAGRRAAADVAFGVWAIAVVGFFGARAFGSGPNDELGPLGLQPALWVGGPSKLLAFALATVFCWRAAAALGEDTPTRAPWATLGGGFAAFFVAQSILVVHQLVVPGPTPYPSPADAAFMVGYGLMIGSLISFVRLYVGSGLLPVDPRSLRRTGAAAGLAVLALLVPVEWSIQVVGSEEPWLERLIGGAYPVLDGCLIVLAALMLRVTVAMRGSVFVKPWILLLVGFVTFTLGDALYALPQPAWVTDPLLDMSFAGGYLACAWGSQAQDRLLRTPLH